MVATIYVLVFAGISAGGLGVGTDDTAYKTLKECEAKKHEYIASGVSPQAAGAGIACVKIDLKKNPNYKPDAGKKFD